MSQFKSRKKYIKLAFVLFVGIGLAVGWFFVSDETSRAGVALIISTPEVQEQDLPVVVPRVFGYSVTGRAIDGYEIGSGPTTILLFSSIHGNEVGTVDLLAKFVEEVQSQPELVSPSKRLIVVPIANPDGYFDRIDKLNANGVNLNLNFPTSDWQLYGQEGDYAGQEPFSEPESNVIKQIVEQYHPDMMISFHAKGALISPESDDSSIALARWYSAKSGYEYYNAWDFSGTATKWFEETTAKPAITVELTTHASDDWEINKGALFELVSSESLPYLVSPQGSTSPTQ